MRRPQFSIGALLIAMLAAACFFGGVHFEQRRKQRDAAALPTRSARGVQTVYVRLANAAALPGDSGQQLAEAVRRRIETTTPYKAVSIPSEADSELVCTVFAEGQTQLVGEYSLTARWLDGKGLGLQPPLTLRFRPSEFSDKRTVAHFAAQIGGMMEAPW